MSDRTYRALLGALLLMALTFDLNYGMYILVAILLMEGLTNFRLPLLSNRITGAYPATTPCVAHPEDTRYFRIGFEAERAWRLLVGTMLLITYVLFYGKLWFFPWFMGFAILGAGVSGVCPMQYALKRVGFR